MHFCLTAAPVFAATTPRQRQLSCARLVLPHGLSVENVAGMLRSLDGVLDVHHLNLWSVCSHIFALSAHVEIDPAYDGQRSELLHRIEHALQHTFHITHTTIQFDCSTCNGGPLVKEFSHSERKTSCCGHTDH